MADLRTGVVRPLHLGQNVGESRFQKLKRRLKWRIDARQDRRPPWAPPPEFYPYIVWKYGQPLMATAPPEDPTERRTYEMASLWVMEWRPRPPRN